MKKKATKKKPKEEVYNWPLWFSQTLEQKEQKKINKIIPQLARAQAYLWRALNIYDDFLDSEGKKQELPLANNYFRLFLETHYRLNLPSDYYRLFNKILTGLNRANRDEVQAQKLEIKNRIIICPSNLRAEKPLLSLAQKSLALALGPLAILAILGHRADSKKIKSTLNFFRYALAAKQLADDSHDWLDDLKQGSITFANSPIILSAKKEGLKLDLKHSAAQAYLLFARDASPKIICSLNYLCRRARKELIRAGVCENSLIVNKLVRPFENACQKAQNFRSLLGPAGVIS